MPKNFIVITTINPKTEGIRRFEAFPDYHLVIVGDKKTPHYPDTDNLTFLSVERQAAEFPKLAELLPYNHYTRKNLGYLYALKHGAERIYDTDDDNLPYERWGFEPFECPRTLESSRVFINIYKYFTDHAIWPRGLPLDEVRSTDIPAAKRLDRPAQIGVWQGLADNDPDVDAIYRLTNGELITFDHMDSVALPRSQYAPFNSQNTLWRKELAPLMYLPARVSFRLTDILRSYIAQVIMHRHGYHLGYCGATVYQERNEHDLMKDFRDEIDCYLNIKAMVECLEAVSYTGDVSGDLMAGYIGLMQDGFVPREELGAVTIWTDIINELN